MENNCNCSVEMPFHNRCHPMNIGWDNCPMRADTTYHLIINDAEFPPETSSRSDLYENIRWIACDYPYDIRDDNSDELLELIYLFEKEEMKSGKYICKYCDKFIRIAEMNDYDNDDNVCWSCSITHYCVRCFEYTENANERFECDRESEHYKEFNNHNICSDCHRQLADGNEYVLK